MKVRTAAHALSAPLAAALLLAGCGSARPTAATSTARAPLAAMVGSGTPPVAGATSTSAKRATTIATGKHDRAGESCSGRDQARFAAEGLVCVTGRLKPKR